MTWIKAHAELREHPKRKRLSRLLGMDTFATIGLLNCLWWWATDYAPDGDLSRYEPTDIADGIDYAGDPDELIASLQDAGFLDGMLVHDWYDYAGRLIEQRETNAERMRAKRAEGVHGTCSARAGLEKKEKREKRDKINILSDETPDPGPQSPSRASVIRGRFDHWRSVFPEKTARLTLTKDRERAINARLAEGIAPETIDLAVSNARGDPWWNGSKDGEWKADIKTICGKGSTLENLAARVKVPETPRARSTITTEVLPEPTAEDRAASLAIIAEARRKMRSATSPKEVVV